MVECICINDTNKPIGIPMEEWVVKDREYTVTWIFFDPMKNELGVQLKEVNQTERSLPYEGFIITRFAFRKGDLQAIIELFKACNEAADVNIEELLKEKEVLV